MVAGTHVAVLERTSQVEASTLYRRALEVANGLAARGTEPGSAIAIPDRPTLDCLVVELGARLARLDVTLTHEIGVDSLAFIGSSGALALRADDGSSTPLDLLAARGIAWAARSGSAGEAIALPETAARDASATWAGRVVVLAPISTAAIRAARDQAIIDGATLCLVDPFAGVGIEATVTRFDAVAALATPHQLDDLATAIARRSGTEPGWRALLRRHPGVARRVARGGLPRGFRNVTTHAAPTATTLAWLEHAGITFSLASSTP